jgi:trehalose 6-phosphate phosphatase
MSRPPSPSPAWAYFLDVDGTLLELAETPEAVRVGHDVVFLIRALHANTGGAVALVSGRSLADLDRHFGLGDLCAAGQHGIERRDATGRIFRHLSSAAPGELVGERLAPLLALHPGLRIEDKGATLAVHYRQAPRLGAPLSVMLRKIVAGMPGFELQPGKRVLEIKAAGYDKGSAVAEFMGTLPFRGRTAVFIGDDLTDESAFAVVNRLDGVSVKVGAGATSARHRLPDVRSVRGWLGELARNSAIDAQQKEEA